MGEHAFTQLGELAHWGDSAPFGLGARERRQHLYVVGKSGVGKTTLLQNLIVQDIAQGRGIGVIDPHGDLAEALLDQIPPHRLHEVIYFNPADPDFAIGLNPIQGHDRSHLTASGIVDCFKSIWRDSWGPRMEYTLYAAVAALLDCENVSFLSLQRMLSDGRYRDWVVRQVKDPVVRSFWENEFARYEPKFAREVVAPIQNKVGQLLMAAPLRHVLGQVRNRIDARSIMDSGNIFIANLAKGRLGEDKSNLLGSLLVTQFKLAAMSRTDMSEAERRDFGLVIDEFQNFSTDSFASILSESRKYRLGLVLSHQYTSQLSESVRDAVFGNVGSLISFQVGSADANLLAQEFGHDYKASTFTELGRYEVCVKLLSERGQNSASLGRTYPPFEIRHGRRGSIINLSRQRYASPRRDVEEKINRWMGR